MKPPVFEIESREADGTVLLALSGELDLAGAPELDAALSSVREAGKGLTIDLSELDFIDSSGLGVLVRFHNAAGTAGYEYSVIAGPPPVHRAFVLSGLDQALPFAARS
ncbi:anti-sigma B factor antagonist/stage II sporulation protein AA (anti-sigma F factor antagonist) [Solirubrobacter pauli]|uniref:Anti-sigma factor antagonist n=1 Tax=Solirubrobacter pauli TaxID=166793 RepID=A0A660L1M0_9ACTN|nr:STAS domain-containing protein [Solirubrobacter pauli]RKQ87205.1 anti-sigma B factor antagonist/stage II sporulation protein AA (anti-sigma F factor antagonist) [Solirubrobacter pauli]